MHLSLIIYTSSHGEQRAYIDLACERRLQFISMHGIPLFIPMIHATSILLLPCYLVAWLIYHNPDLVRSYHETDFDSVIEKLHICCLLPYFT